MLLDDPGPHPEPSPGPVGHVELPAHVAQGRFETLEEPGSLVRLGRGEPAAFIFIREIASAEGSRSLE